MTVDLTIRHAQGYSASAPTEYATVARNVRTKMDKPIVVYCHGRGQAVTATEPGAFSPTYGPVLYELALRGHPVIAADLGGNAWGNDTALARIDDAVNYMRTIYGASSAPILMWGISMGSTTTMNYVRANPSKVARVALADPIFDLADVHDRNVNSFAAEIETAYGGLTGYQAALPTHSPKAYIAQYAKSTRAWYSTDDPVGQPADAISYAQNNKYVDIVSLGAVGHAITGLKALDVADWLEGL